MRTTAKADYAVRAAVELASSGDGPVTAEHLAEAQQIPVNFLENILLDLRRAGIIESRRGASGGYLLAKPAHEIVVADVTAAAAVAIDAHPSAFGWVMLVAPERELEKHLP